MKKRKRTFRHKLVIEHQTVVGVNSLNQPVYDWATFATVWGEVDPLKGREYIASKQAQAELTHRITIRYIPGIKPTMRIKWGERIFEIDGPPINPYESNYEIQLMCKEKVS